MLPGPSSTLSQVSHRVTADGAIHSTRSQTSRVTLQAQHSLISNFLSLTTEFCFFKIAEGKKEQEEVGSKSPTQRVISSSDSWKALPGMSPSIMGSPQTFLSTYCMSRHGNTKMNRQKRQVEGTRSARQGHVAVTQHSCAGSPLTLPRQVTHPSF